MTVVMGAFDVLLAASLVWTAARALGTENLLMAVALFVAFGLLMTLAWVRLASPDIALAEAGIGTGFSGALLLAAIARLRRLSAARSDIARDGEDNR